MTDARLDRLDEVSEQLRSLYRSYATAAQIERKQRVETVQALVAQGYSVAAAEREADAQCVIQSVEIVGFTGQIKALEEERDHLRFLVKWDRA